MRLTLSGLALAAAASTAVPSVYAWGAAGHEIVATIAQSYLHPSVLPQLCTVLNLHNNPDYPRDPDAPPCHISTIATWADKIRYLPQFRWTAPMHYIGARDDWPSQTCAFPGDKGWSGRDSINVLGAIRNVSGTLEEFVAAQRDGLVHLNFNGEGEDDDAEDIRTALKFLIHFLGDLHMPLHLTGRDRGGNSIKVRFDGRLTNLHSLWDGLLIAQRLRTVPSNYTRAIPVPELERNLRDTIYDPYIRQLVWEGAFGKYADELEDWLSCPSAPSESNSMFAPFSSATSSLLREAMEYTGLHAAHQGAQRLFSWLGLSSGLAKSGSEDPHKWDDETLCPYAWAAPIHALNCEIVFPPALDEPPYGSHAFPRSYPAAPHVEGHGCAHAHAHEDLFEEEGEVGVGAEAEGRKSKYIELDTPEYAGELRRRWVVERLLLQAGVRLAGTLNYLFAEEGALEGRVRALGL
ncbi:phospholipase C P1 nuclease [Coniophora puteana RWD-64-598 SS2]|uniref:Phospholipase C P1 nuclease n=1 Tax=Coniophora puteana (strain RWD-64-598) TaxID=741705 RepID=R7SF51_CONPW|nr:phospholipase C P1 nuclease [Coniophora puteana RWD-64-598 SS2]EIW74377.1 phospholipase C P1 nuclease [Coniophora puteana RWD-64-598 SS2]